MSCYNTILYNNNIYTHVDIIELLKLHVYSRPRLHVQLPILCIHCAAYVIALVEEVPDYNRCVNVHVLQ